MASGEGGTAGVRDADGRIEIRGLTKRFGTLTAVDGLDFAVAPGRITGFLGPNGSGKTTTLRMLLGLVRPNAGTATIGGRAYRDIPNPLTVVGSALEATNFHPGRSGRNHLRVLATASGAPTRRVDELLELVGLQTAGRQRAGGYSMGMRQRLGLAAALVGDPRVLILDEPANGLDPDGIRWLRGVLRHLADEGRTLLVSSHMLAEVEQTVDDVVIISRGRLVAQGTVADLRGRQTAYVRTSDPETLATALGRAGLDVRQDGPALTVATDDLVAIGDVALAADVAIHELRRQQTRLEELFFTLTEDTGHPPAAAAELAGATPGATPAAADGTPAPGSVTPAPAPPPPGPAPVPADLPPPTGAPVATPHPAAGNPTEDDR